MELTGRKQVSFKGKGYTGFYPHQNCVVDDYIIDSFYWVAEGNKAPVAAKEDMYKAPAFTGKDYSKEIDYWNDSLVHKMHKGI